MIDDEPPRMRPVRSVPLFNFEGEGDWHLPAVEWCEQNCQFRFRFHKARFTTIFLFESVSDAVNFGRTWVPQGRRQ